MANRAHDKISYFVRYSYGIGCGFQPCGPGWPLSRRLDVKYRGRGACAHQAPQCSAEGCSRVIPAPANSSSLSRAVTAYYVLRYERRTEYIVACCCYSGRCFPFRADKPLTMTAVNIGANLEGENKKIGSANNERGRRSGKYRMTSKSKEKHQ